MDLRDRLQSTLGSAYTLEREFASGGMSRVFLAQETALGRQVVVKLLSGDVSAGISAERFAREVRLAASLQHPNIVPVLATGVADGTPWYTMPYVRGESLRARMSPVDPIAERHALSILRDIARALKYAHAEGVIHRDIKPENVLLSGDAAVVTDFGIAKAISVARTASHDERPQVTLTRAGSTVGTPAYMAPEQVAGDTMDHRVDLYAWGLIAYELLSGKHPFADKTNITHLLAAQMAEAPVPLGTVAPNIPAPIADVVMQCLAKSPGDRPASATELLESLDTSVESGTRSSVTRVASARTMRIPFLIGAAVLLAGAAYTLVSNRPSAAPAPVTRSVAVLPFDHDAADSAEAYLGEGLADELMTALGKIEGLRVASRTSSIAVAKRNDLDIREIANRLGVATIVEGTVRRSGGKLRVTAQLTNAADGLTMWSDSYDREATDVFAVQSEITQSIIAALRPELGHRLSGSAPGPGTTNADAYDLYLRGVYLVERRGPGVERGAEYFTQAIQKDPQFARAHAALATALQLFPYFSSVPAHVVEPRARAAAERSLSLDPSLAEPRVALAMSHWHGFRWSEADQEFRRAISADSTSAVARTQYGRYLVTVGRVDDAIRELRIARRLDPLAATSSVWLSKALAYNGEQAAAVEESRRSRELDPDLLNNRTVLVFDIVRDGKHAEALSVMGDAIPHTPFNGMTAYNLERAGSKARALQIRRGLEALPDTTYFVHTGRTWTYLSIGDTAAALKEMETAVAEREIIPQMIPFEDWLYDSIRQSARFAAVMKQLGLEDRGFTGPNGGRRAR